MQLTTMYPGLINSPVTKLAAPINATQTEIEVLDQSAVPEPPNLLVIGTDTQEPETVKILGKNNGTLSVVRGFQGSAKNYPAGTEVARNFTEYDYSAIISNIGALNQSLSRAATITVCASNSGEKSKAAADFICTGDKDHLTIQAAIDALPESGGRVLLMEGDYILNAVGQSPNWDGLPRINYLTSNCGVYVHLKKSNCSLEGIEGATRLKFNVNSGCDVSLIVILASQKNCSVKGLTIDTLEFPADVKNTVFGICCLNSDDFKAFNNTIVGNYPGKIMSMEIQKSNRASVCNNVFRFLTTSMQRDISIMESNSCVVSKNMIFSGIPENQLTDVLEGIVIFNSEYCILEGNIIKNYSLTECIYASGIIISTFSKNNITCNNIILTDVVAGECTGIEFAKGTYNNQVFGNFIMSKGLESIGIAFFDNDSSNNFLYANAIKNLRTDAQVPVAALIKGTGNIFTLNDCLGRTISDLGTNTKQTISGNRV